jgi:WD40 repeat protein
MHRSIRRAAAALAAGAALSAFGITGISTAGAASRVMRSARPAARPLASSGAQLWLRRYNGPGNGDDSATALAISPNGRTVYVTGRSTGATSGLDYATVAYRAATGTRLWVARYNGPGHGDDSASALAISPNGRTLYVTGTSSGEYATVAYSASTGAQLWVARHHGPAADGTSSAVAVTVSPDNSTVFVTGTTQYGDDPACADSAYDTVAYGAATGTQLWSAQMCGFSSALALSVSPDGKRVYVTGQWDAECGACMLYGTVAYNAATGTTIWTRYYGVQGAQAGNGSAIAVSPDGAKVYVTGTITRTDGGSDYGTIAYSAAGRQLWIRRYRTPGPFSNLNLARSLAVSPAGTVVVTGYRPGPEASGRNDYATVAYSPAGKRLWVKLYNATGKGSNVANSVAAPGNGKVYVTGSSQGTKSGLDYATIAYDIFTGAQLWVRRYNGPANGDDQAISLAARSGRVFVTGSSEGTKSGLDYATIAYKG